MEKTNMGAEDGKQSIGLLPSKELPGNACLRSCHRKKT